jgi:hypothetical protein
MPKTKTTAALMEEPTGTANQFGLSVQAGDLLLLENKLYITYAGALKIARRNRCSGISTEVVAELSEPGKSRFVVKASVFKTSRSRPFEGYGDADPSNVSALVRGAELRVAETRAVHRALRKAFAIPFCSIEEIGSRSESALHPTVSRARSEPPCPERPEVSLRDQLALLIRRHRLDPEQVKRYAQSFCQVGELRHAKREQIRAFLDHLQGRVDQDCAALMADLAATISKPPGSVQMSDSHAGVIA